MNRVWRNAIVVASLVLMIAAAPSRGQVPSGNDTSDGASNTGGGTGALVHNTPGTFPAGFFSTAYGADALNANTSGFDNVALGFQALLSNTSGSENTSVGANALLTNNQGSENTAVGSFALFNNNTSYNTATGFAALFANTTGVDNTATGYLALQANTTGFNNTATGWEALMLNTTGIENTATGEFALEANISGEQNTADGKAALFGNTGSFNTGTGYKTLFSNRANNNTAAGWEALFSNTTGNNNTAIGENALKTATTGANNIALGFRAGVNVTKGSNNVEIANNGASADSNTIKIGQQGIQKSTFIAGIFGSRLSGAANVIVTATGQLGVIASSARYKRDVQAIGERSRGLMQLRPVTFRYKQDPLGARQYGLIAEEVAQVYPELVVRGTKGEVESVQYLELVSMLLNEFQQQQRTLDMQASRLSAQSRQLADLKAQNESLRASLAELNTAMNARLTRLEHATVRTTTLVSH